MKILFIDIVHPLLKKELEKNNHECETAFDLSKFQIENIIEKYNGIIIRSKFIIDENFIKKATNLKFIARAGSGLENINIDFAKKQKIKCYNASEGNRQAVAEHALGMILSLFNNLRQADAEIRSGCWNRETNRGTELSGKTVAIIGYGNNGSAFSRLLEGFGVNIISYDKYLVDYPFKSSMKYIFENADILSIHIPLTEETSYLINDKYINNFKKNIYLINTARGKCVNTEHLVKSLKNGKIQGACLDVLEYENISFENLKKDGLEENLHYLTNCSKVILSPHIAGWTHESNLKIAKILFQKISNDFS